MQSWRGGMYTTARRITALFSGVGDGSGPIGGVMILGSKRLASSCVSCRARVALNQRMGELAPTYPIGLSQQRDHLVQSIKGAATHDIFPWNPVACNRVLPVAMDDRRPLMSRQSHLIWHRCE